MKQYKEYFYIMIIFEECLHTHTQPHTYTYVINIGAIYTNNFLKDRTIWVVNNQIHTHTSAHLYDSAKQENKEEKTNNDSLQKWEKVCACISSILWMNVRPLYENLKVKTKWYEKITIDKS